MVGSPSYGSSSYDLLDAVVSLNVCERVSIVFPLLLLDVMYVVGRVKLSLRVILVPSSLVPSPLVACARYALIRRSSSPCDGADSSFALVVRCDETSLFR